MRELAVGKERMALIGILVCKLVEVVHRSHTKHVPRCDVGSRQA